MAEEGVYLSKVELALCLSIPVALAACLVLGPFFLLYPPCLLVHPSAVLAGSFHDPWVGLGVSYSVAGHGLAFLFHQNYYYCCAFPSCQNHLPVGLWDHPFLHQGKNDLEMAEALHDHLDVAADVDDLCSSSSVVGGLVHGAANVASYLH